MAFSTLNLKISKDGHPTSVSGLCYSPGEVLFKVFYHLLCSLKRFLLHESLSRSGRYDPDTALFPAPDMEIFSSSQLVRETICYMIYT